MASELLADLPAELLIRIGEHLDVKDCASLSAVNSDFRQFLGSTLFKGLRATNRSADAQIIEQLVSKYGKYVQRLNFQLYLNEVWEEDGQERPYSIESTAPVIWDLLSRRALPKLSTLKITFCPEPEDFNGDHWCDEGLGGSIYINDGEETVDELAEIEETFAWRALFSKTLETVATGEIPLHRLEVRNLPPKTTSAQQTEEWAAFLGSLEEFDLSLWGGDNGAGWHSNTVQGYLDSIENLRSTIFRHLTSAKKVRFASDSQNPVGCEGWRQCPLPFESKDMPELEHLELQDCFIDTALVKNLERKPGQLRSLTLIDCFSAGNDNNRGLADVVISWAEFFSRLHHSQPNLENFTLNEGRQAPLTHDEQFHEPRNGPFVPPDNEEKDVKAVRKARELDPNRTIFPYVTLDDKYGMVFAYEEVNIMAFLDGSDQREFDKFMGVIRGNQMKMN